MRTLQLTVLRCQRITFGHRAFSAAGPMVWNSLSTEFRDLSVSSSVFRRTISSICLSVCLSIYLSSITVIKCLCSSCVIFHLHNSGLQYYCTLDSLLYHYIICYRVKTNYKYSNTLLQLQSKADCEKLLDRRSPSFAEYFSRNLRDAVESLAVFSSAHLDTVCLPYVMCRRATTGS